MRRARSASAIIDLQLSNELKAFVATHGFRHDVRLLLGLSEGRMQQLINRDPPSLGLTRFGGRTHVHDLKPIKRLLERLHGLPIRTQKQANEVGIMRGNLIGSNWIDAFEALIDKTIAPSAILAGKTGLYSILIKRDDRATVIDPPQNTSGTITLSQAAKILFVSKSTISHLRRIGFIDYGARPSSPSQRESPLAISVWELQKNYTSISELSRVSGISALTIRSSFRRLHCFPAIKGSASTHAMYDRRAASMAVSMIGDAA